MKAKAQKAHETRTSYRVKISRTRPIKPRASKLLQTSPELPQGPSWQKLETWRAWKRKHIQKFEREYPGKYLAVWEKKIIATGNTWGEAYDKAQWAKPTAVPWITYVPTPEEMNCVPIFNFPQRLDFQSS